MNSSTFSFAASRVPVDLPPHSVPCLGFELGEGGEPHTYVSFMYEDGDGVVRAWWGDGRAGADEVVVRLRDAALSAEGFSARVEAHDGQPRTEWPFDSIHVTFSLGEQELGAAREALALLLAPRTSRAVVGPPSLGARAEGEWKGAVGRLELAIAVSNHGGPLDGIVVELGGAAIDRRLLRLDGIASPNGAGEPSGASWRVPLRLPAHVVDDPPAQPVVPPRAVRLLLTFEAARAGNELLTVRLIPVGAVGRTGAILVGRPVTVR